VTENQATAPNTAEDEVAALCSDLIRIDTSNRGDHSGPGERKAAELVAALLDESGWKRRSTNPIPAGPASLPG
jgi:acetylornithine deacetylase/succinyl-diaminopimelate desuccinylase-like protein